MRPAPPISVQQWTRALSRWDVLAVLLVLGILIFFAEASRNLPQPMAELRMTPISLEPTHPPEYAARTTLRMLLAASL
jgi:NitT/TauT family transport system permease protein